MTSVAATFSYLSKPAWENVRPFAKWEHRLASLLVFCIVFLNGADFVGKAGDEEFTVHWQIYLRLLVSLASGVAGLFWLFPVSYRDFLTWPGILVTIYTLWNGVSVVFSIEPMYSMAAWCSLFGIVLFIPAGMRVLGATDLLKTMGFSTALYLAGSWIAYWYFPEIGIWQEKITQTDIVERMGGLGHPNELGFYSAYTLILFSVLTVSRKVSPLVSAPVLLMATITLVSCLSRTSMLVTVLALLVVLQGWLRLRANTAIVFFVASLAFLLLFAALSTGRLDWIVEDTLLSLTKSGNTDELFTATGRTEIWAYGLGRILESPLFGYGYCTARFVMIDHSFHCHNIVLNTALNGGLVAGAVVGIAWCYLLFCVFFRRDFAIDGLAITIVVVGLVEEMIGAPSPSVNLFIFVVALFWRQLGMSLWAATVSSGSRLRNANQPASID